MKLFLKILTLLFCYNCAIGQTVNWAKPDSIIYNSVEAIYEDTTDHSAYIGGFYFRVGSDTIVGIGKYKNGQWFRMGDGVDWFRGQALCSGCLPNPVTGIIKYQDTIYITGQFTHTNGRALNGIAKWDGTSWQPIGRGFGSGSTGGYGKKLKVYNNELYVTGTFDSIAGVVAHGLAKYNGHTWQSVCNLPRFDINSPNYVEDIAFYNNELYIAGTFGDNSTIFNVAKWNGSSWVNPGFGVYGNSTVLGLFNFKNDLYAYGTWSIYDNPNNIGNCIAKYNGTSWKPAGGGMLFYPNNLAIIKSYAITSSYLFVGGYFNVCNYTKGISSIARFDGTNWCSLDTTLHTSDAIEAMGFVKDTLYVGGYLGSQFNTSGFAYCKNINYTDTCNQSYDLGIQELDPNAINLFPNPVTSFITISDKQNELQGSSVEISNGIGQVVLKQLYTEQLDVSGLSPGYYFLSIRASGRQYHAKFIKQQ